MNGSITYTFMIIICLQYEPELFPGLIYRMKVPKIVLLIFVSGKVVLTGKLFGPDALACCWMQFCRNKTQDGCMTPCCCCNMQVCRPGLQVHAGAKDKEQIYKAFENIYPVLGQFRKGDVPAFGAALPQPAQPASLVRYPALSA